MRQTQSNHRRRQTWPAVAFALGTLLSACNSSEPRTETTMNAPPAQGAPLNAEVPRAAAKKDASSLQPDKAATIVAEQSSNGAAFESAGTVFRSQVYRPLALDFLSSFRYEHPDPAYLESVEDPALLKLKDQFPPQIKALHGQKVAVQGYIIPIGVDDEWRLKSFLLVKDQTVCCYGRVPAENEKIYVRLGTPQRTEFFIDVPVTVFGTLEVGEEIKYGTLASLYRIQADRLRCDY
jgi:hypothetical protein